MNIEILKYFIDIADLKSISKVSIKSHISQSALSQMMQKLEDNLGYTVFERSNKGVELTEMGKVVYEYATNILHTHNKMLAELASLEKNKIKIIINSTWALSFYSLPSLILEAKRKYPNFDFEIQSNRSEDIVKNVENGLADIGIIYGDYFSAEIISTQIGEEKIVLVALSDFNIDNTITLDELFDYQLIYFKNGCYNTDIKKVISEHLSSEDVNKYGEEPLLNLDSISAVKASIFEGHGIGFLPYSAVKKEVNEKQFKIIDIENISIVLKINLIYTKINQNNHHIKKIVEFFMRK